MGLRATAAALLVLVGGCGADETSTPDTTVATREAARTTVESPEAVAARRFRQRADPSVPDPAAAQAPTSAAEWARRLRNGEATDDERAQAIEALIRIGAPSVPWLVDALDDPTAGPLALTAIARLGPAAVTAAPVLLDRMRRHAGLHGVPAISRMGPAAIPALEEAVTDPSPELRRGAANALMLLAHQAGLDAAKGDSDAARRIAATLAGLVHDSDPMVRQIALGGLSFVWIVRSGTEALLLAGLADESSVVRRSVATWLSRCPGDATAVVAGLVHALDDPDHWVAVAAAEAICALGDRAGTERLRVLEFAKDHRMQRARLADRVGLETLRAGLLSPDGDVRRLATEALARMGTGAAAAAPALVDALDDASPAIRVSALDALAAAGPGADALPRVRAAFAAPETNVRAAAARALGRMPAATEDVIADLVRGLADPEADIRRESAIAIGRLASQPSVCVKALVVALDDVDLVVRAAAATALGAFGAAAAEALPDLRRCLAHADPWIRLGAATSLPRVESPSPAAFEAFRKLVVDGDVNVRWRSVFALGSLATEDCVPLLVGRVDDRSAKVRMAAANALAGMGPTAAAAVPALEALSKSRDVELAAAGAQALAAVRPK